MNLTISKKKCTLPFPAKRYEDRRRGLRTGKGNGAGLERERRRVQNLGGKTAERQLKGANGKRANGRGEQEEANRRGRTGGGAGGDTKKDKRLRKRLYTSDLLTRRNKCTSDSPPRKVKNV